MKAEWVRIKNFRSIEDTGRIYIDSNLTVLAGKNESGKSNILRALEAFSLNDFSHENYPEGMDKKGISPSVEVSFKIYLSEFKQYLKDTNDYHKAPHVIPFTFTVKKFLASNEQVTYGTVQNVIFNGKRIGIINKLVEGLMFYETTNEISEDWKRIRERLYKNAQIILKEVHNENRLKTLDEFVDDLMMLCNMKFVKRKNGEKRVSTGELRDMFPQDIQEYIIEIVNIRDKIVNEYNELEQKFVIPKFVMLESFEKLLPDSIGMLSDDDDDIWSRYVHTALRINKENSVFEISHRDLKRRVERVSNEITNLFQRVYTQNSIQLELDIGAQNALNLYIYDQGSDVDFLPSQRSKGFQWFLSFFFAINAVKEEQNIILIDEPGPYLHPKAQKDVLKALEVITESNQIVFTTHSPYLIDPNNLERVRLIIRGEDNHTTIENQIHASAVADQEVYTPIITAIGLDLSGSFGTFGDYNTIVEGISDYYYLECMKKYIGDINQFGEMRFIPSIGASQIDKLASLLIGWGVNFKVLLDNDNAGKTEKKELEEKLLLVEEQLLFVSDEPGFAIEDLFSREDFLVYVAPGLKIPEGDEGLKNSSLLKGKKALVAKMFKERLQKEEITFTSQTIDNFTNIFHKLYGVNDVRAEVMESVR
ncbi:endonuclease [Bacillus anthracis]|uniref:AAA family ATPase n=1 Tax=Bacillus anthracis TaxID=1392 RepID=UPI0010A6414A|nr:AAA family ATPase [Bacillus anthracis]QBJ65040.1 endonuclease [Bacillus anthracis]THG54746.1 endonuclease [Bacillus sp. HUB-I-004]